MEATRMHPIGGRICRQVGKSRLQVGRLEEMVKEAHEFQGDGGELLEEENG